MKDMLSLEKELLMELGFGKFYNNDINKLPEGEYKDMMVKYNTNEIKAAHENLMVKDFGPVFMLKHFPVHTSPFWNMRTENGVAKKCDVIL
jgi:aspartyl/asparaginyl-tRNA synthetase